MVKYKLKKSINSLPLSIEAYACSCSVCVGCGCACNCNPIVPNELQTSYDDLFNSAKEFLYTGTYARVFN